jgi:hypothetical protein
MRPTDEQIKMASVAVQSALADEELMGKIAGPRFTQLKTLFSNLGLEGLWKGLGTTAKHISSNIDPAFLKNLGFGAGGTAGIALAGKALYNSPLYHKVVTALGKTGLGENAVNILAKQWMMRNMHLIAGTGVGIGGLGYLAGRANRPRGY